MNDLAASAFGSSERIAEDATDGVAKELEGLLWSQRNRANTNSHVAREFVR